MIRHALFDWDGTLSLLRAGWAEVMIQQWIETLPPLLGESRATQEQRVHDEIWGLNGKPTIHQMARLAELVTESGGAAKSAISYNEEYQNRLATLVRTRADQVRNGMAAPDEFMVTGARAFLDLLSQRGIQLHLASGTELRFITEEAKLLGLADYFGSRFHGPSGPDDRSFSKRGVMDGILAQTGLPGGALVAFGDGHVEIEQSRAVGGWAVAVCSDESAWRSGKLDPAKLKRLTEVGANFSVPDFAHPEKWLAQLPLAG